MGVWKRIFRTQDQQDVDFMRRAVKDSFARVAQDVVQLKGWIIHLHQTQGHLQEDHHAHKQLREQEAALLTQKIAALEQEQTMLARYFSDLLDYLQKKNEIEAKFASELNEFKSELELIKHRRQTNSEPIIIPGSHNSSSPAYERESALTTNPYGKTTSAKGDHRKAGNQNQLEEKILQRFRAHRKDYILQKIMEIIESSQSGTKELEQIVVDEKGLCGRTSFFAYLKELRLKGIVEDSWVENRKILSFKRKISKKTEIS